MRIRIIVLRATVPLKIQKMFQSFTDFFIGWPF